MGRTNKLWSFILFAAILLCLGNADAFAKDYTFSWTANAEPVDGYKLYYKLGGEAGIPFDGTGAGDGDSPIDVGKVTTYTITGLLDNTTYHFALTAYSGTEESDFTDIITVFPEGDTTTVTADPLTAVISATPLEGVAELTVTFDATGSSGSIDTYNWDFGDGEVGSGVSPSHTYVDAGTYNATLNVTDTDGATDQASVTITVSLPPNPPVAIITASAISGTLPLTVSFSGTNSTTETSGITAYNWVFGDSSTGSGETVSHTYTSAGTYTATLTVEDSNGTSEAASVAITVTNPDPPVASIGISATTGVAPLTVNFDGSGSTGTGLSYVWNFGDNAGGTGASVSHEYTIAGTYSATLTVTDVAGQSASQSATVVVQAADETTVDQTTDGTTDGTTTGTKSYTFSWTANAEPVDGYKLYYKQGGEAAVPFDGTGAGDGDSPIDVGKVTTYTITGLLENTTYHFALTAYSGSEESDFTDIITVFPADDTTTGSVDPLSAIISADPIDGMAGLTVTFDASGSSGSIDLYSWDFGDNTTGTGVSNSHTYTNAGTYTATLTIADASGATDQASATITVSAQPNPPVASITASAISGTVPLTVSFDGSNSTTEASGITAFNWAFGDTTTGTGETVSHEYSVAGTYTVTLTVEDVNGVSEEANVTITVSNPEPPVASMSASVTAGVAPLGVTFNASGSTGTGLSYAWDFGDNSNGSGVSVLHEYSAAGVYNVTLMVTDIVGALNQTSVSITVSNPPNPPVANITATPASGEAPLVVSLSGSGSITETTGITAYNWTFGDSTTGSGQTVSHEYTAAGTYTALLTVEDANGVSEEASVTITVTEPVLPDPPVASVGASVTTGAAPLTVSFDGSGSTGTDITYTWDFGDGTSGSGMATSHEYSAVGTFTAILTVTDTAGQSSSQSVTVVATEAETGTKSYTFSWTANPEPVEGYKLYYKKGGDAVAPFDGVDAAEGVSPINVGKVTTFTISGLEDNTTYHFALTAYNGDEESDFTDIITVYPADGTTTGTEAPLAAVISVVPQEGVEPLVVAFSASGSTGTIVDYSWNFGDGEVGSGQTVSHQFATAGVYTTTLTVTDDQSNTVQDVIDISVTEAGVILPAAPTAVITVSSSEGVVPFTVAFSGGGSSGADGVSIVSYEWDFGDGSEVVYGATAEHIFNEPATYTVALKVTDSYGQTAETDVSVTATSAVVVDNQVPIAAFSASVAKGKFPLDVSFDASASSDPDGDDLSYTWSFGDGGGATGVTASNIYSEPGTYSVELIVKDVNGATATSTRTITVLTEEEYVELITKRNQLLLIINQLLLQDE